MLDIHDYLEAEAVFRFFEEISAIPHGSSNTGMIADYLAGFAEERGLEYTRDGADNVVIRKPATPGYEERPTVILQGHLDMVAEKKPGSEIDMEREGLTLYRDGDFIRAKDTTLGGDDGVAIAYALALLDSDDIPHPAIEAVITSDEEIGLLGAVALRPETVHGRLLINIDSDAEGILTVGCAGGMRSDITLTTERKDESEMCVLTVSLGGFKGGHSGVEIDKGRVNAVMALAEVISECEGTLVSISGGNADNAIPRCAECKLVLADTTAVGEALHKMKLKYKDIEPGITWSVTELNEPCSPMTREASERLKALLIELPTGVVAMSSDIEGLVETSLNLGILRCDGDRAEISFSVRSAKGAKKRELGDRLKACAEKYGAAYSERGEYPAWEYKEESHLRNVMVDVYESMYGKKPEVIIIHAGLECGILSEKLPGLDCVSIGPDNFDIHTTEEHLSISSTARVWEYLKKVLKEI